MNLITLTGRLVQDINNPTGGRQLYGKVTGTDNSFYGNSIAVNDGYYDKQNNWVERDYFFNIRAYGRLADRLASQFAQGDPVLIQGKLIAEKYTTKEGKSGINNYIQVERVERSNPTNPHRNNEATGQQPAMTQPAVGQPAQTGVSMGQSTAQPQTQSVGQTDMGGQDFNPFDGLPFA